MLRFLELLLSSDETTVDREVSVDPFGLNGPRLELEPRELLPQNRAPRSRSAVVEDGPCSGVLKASPHDVVVLGPPVSASVGWREFGDELHVLGNSHDLSFSFVCG